MSLRRIGFAAKATSVSRLIIIDGSEGVCEAEAADASASSMRPLAMCSMMFIRLFGGSLVGETWEPEVESKPF